MKSCRICFATDVRMIVLGESEEKEFLESLFRSDGINEVGGYYFICYECKALFTKSYNFFKRALRAQRAILLLQDQKSEAIKVNKDMLKTIKTEFGSSMLSYHKVEIDIFFEDKSEDPMCEEEIDTQSLTNGFNRNHEAEDPICEGAIPLNSKEMLRSILNLNETEKEIGSNEVIDGYYNLDYSNYKKSDYRDDANKSYDYKFEEGIDGNEVMKNPLNQDNSNIIIITDTKIKRNNGKNVPKRMRKSNRRPPTEIYVIMNTSSEEAEEEEQKRRKKRFTEINEENIITDKRTRKLNKKYSELELKASDNENGDERKKPKKEEQDYMPNNDESSSESEASYDSYDDNGKRLKRPPREYPRQCDHCEAEIEAAKYHYKHYLIHHTHEMYPYRRTVLPYVCQYCGIRKANQALIQKHEKIHGEKNVPCDKCDMKFHHNTALIRHRNMVHGENTLFCDYCNKGFKNKCDIRLHIRTHTGEKPFKCHLCRAAFAHRGNLNLHLKKHECLDAESKPVTWKSRPRKKDLKMKKEKRAKKKAQAHETDSEDIDLDTLKGRPRKKKALKKENDPKRRCKHKKLTKNKNNMMDPQLTALLPPRHIEPHSFLPGEKEPSDMRPRSTDVTSEPPN